MWKNVVQLDETNFNHNMENKMHCGGKTNIKHQ